MAEMSPLRRRMIEDMMVRNLSPATQRSYVHAVSKFSRYFGRSPDWLGLEDVRVVGDEGVDLGLEIAGQIVVLQQDAILERLMPTLDLALGLRVIGCATDVAHVSAIQPFRQVAGYVARAVIG